MTDHFNPYHTWLGITPQITAPSYYQLLGVAEGETDPGAIASAADQAASKVRACRPGDRAAEWSQLLDEINTARQCLLDPGQRAAYDHQRQAPAAPVASAPAPARGYHRPAPRGSVPAQPVEPEPATPDSGPAPPKALPMKGKTPPPNETPAPAPVPAPEAQPQMPAPGQPMPGYPAQGAPMPGYPAQGYPMPGYPMPGYPMPNYPMPNYPAPGYPAPGYPAPGYPVPGQTPQQAAPGTYPQPGQMPQQQAPAPTPQPTTPSTPQPAPAAGGRPQPRTASSGNAVASNVPVGVAMPAGSSGILAGTAKPAGGVHAGGSSKASSRTKRRRKQTNLLPIVAATIGGLILLAAVALLAMLPGDKEEDKPQSRPPVVNSRPPIVKQRPATRPAPRSRPTTVITQNDGFSNPRTDLPTDIGSTPFDSDMGQEIPIPGLPSTGDPDITPDGTTETLPPLVVSPQPSDVPDGTPTIGPSTPPAGDPADVDATTGDPFANPQDPAVVPPIMSPAGEPSAQDVADLASTLSAARAALAKQDFDAAQAELKKAEALPMRPEHHELFDRLQLLSQYTRSFRQGLEDAVKQFDGGDNINVGTSTTVGFVQSQGDQITVRVAGANRTYALGDLPEGLAIAIADTWLDQDDPANLVTKAAYLASLENPRADRVAKAREWFAEAAKEGIDIGDLGKVIDDKYDLQ